MLSLCKYTHAVLGRDITGEGLLLLEAFLNTHTHKQQMNVSTFCAGRQKVIVFCSFQPEPCCGAVAIL